MGRKNVFGVAVNQTHHRPSLWMEADLLKVGQLRELLVKKATSTTCSTLFTQKRRLSPRATHWPLILLRPTLLISPTVLPTVQWNVVVTIMNMQHPRRDVSEQLVSRHLWILSERHWRLISGLDELQWRLQQRIVFADDSVMRFPAHPGSRSQGQTEAPRPYNLSYTGTRKDRIKWIQLY